MWVFTQNGFISVVDKKDASGKLTARGRDRESLEFVAKALELEDSSITMELPSDYPFRMLLTRQELADYLVLEINDLTYYNFKDQVTKTRGKVWHDSLMRVWSAMLSVTPYSVVQQMREADRIAFASYRPQPSQGRKKGKKSKGRTSDEFLPLYETEPEVWDRDEHFEDDFPEFAALGHKSIHDMTEAEWDAFMSEMPNSL